MTLKSSVTQRVLLYTSCGLRVLLFLFCNTFFSYTIASCLGFKRKFAWTSVEEVHIWKPWQQWIALLTWEKGCHLVHKEIVGQLPELKNYKIGMANVFCKWAKAHVTLLSPSLYLPTNNIVQHTSASLMINENFDSDVQKDMEMGLNKIVPETFPYIHTAEGPDDMVSLYMIWHPLFLPTVWHHADIACTIY